MRPGPANSVSMLECSAWRATLGLPIAAPMIIVKIGVDAEHIGTLISADVKWLMSSHRPE